MRFAAAICLVLCLPLLSEAQGLPSQSLTRGTWELGTFVGGGNGLFAASNTRFLLAGVRVGRILTGNHLPGLLRGNLEYAADFMPLSEVFQPGQKVYGGSFVPVILKWNFTSNSKIAPYMMLAGGGLATTSNIPPGNTSTFNFMAGGSIGAYIFRKRGRAMTLETHWMHISNADLGIQNPQLVANFFFTIGYSWFK
ncbi:MAG TPA: acyloxyacyl hydrolase [Candidatus Acidoferrales bacterium]|nr:acyloxyacyl hydrolase [Candidatus Acidoferrales bacterium]